MGPKELLRKMKNVWKLYERNLVEEPKLKKNKNMKEINLGKIISNI